MNIRNPDQLMQRDMECKYIVHRVKHSFACITCVLLMLGVSLGAYSQDLRQEITKLKDLLKYDEAIALLNQADYRDVDSLFVQQELADCLYASGHLEEALDLYGLLVQSSPENLRNRIRQMTILYQMKLFIPSIDAGRDILQVDSIKYVVSLLGDAFSKIEMADSSILYYGKALQISPNDAKTMGKMCDVMLKEHQYKEIVSITESYLSRYPNHSLIAPYCGLAHYLRGDYRKAVSVFEALLDAGIETPAIHYYNGLSHYRLSEYKEALPDLELVYQMDTTDVAATVYLADTRTKTNAAFDKEVNPLFVQAIEQMKPDSQTMFNIYSTYGEDCQLAGEYKKAIDCYKEALQYDPGFIRAYYFMAICYEKLGNLKSAQSCYNQYLNTGREEPDFLIEYATRRQNDLKAELFMIE